MFFANTKQIIAEEFFSKVFSTKKLSRSYLFLGDNLADKLDFALAITKILNLTKQMVTDQTQYILLKGKSYLEELNLVNSKNFKWKDFPSLTSDESRIIVLQTK